MSGAFRKSAEQVLNVLPPHMMDVKLTLLAFKGFLRGKYEDGYGYHGPSIDREIEEFIEWLKDGTE